MGVALAIVVRGGFLHFNSAVAFFSFGRKFFTG